MTEPPLDQPGVDEMEYDCAECGADVIAYGNAKRDTWEYDCPLCHHHAEIDGVHAPDENDWRER